MEYRQLGRSGLNVSPLVLGGNVMGWTADEARSFAILDAYVEAGGNIIDTADVYPRFAGGFEGGESEAVLGKWLKQRSDREKLVIATKVGGDMGSGKSLRRQHILHSAEDSLRRLQTEYIDLYQTHFDDNVTPVEETLAAYDQLVRQGKVRLIGASNVSVERLEASWQVSQEQDYPSYVTLQPLYNLSDRATFEQTYEPLSQKYDLGVIPYFALASGFLSGKYRSEADLVKSPRRMFVQKYLNERGYRILTVLDEIAREYHATPTQVSLAWLLARPTVTAPIVSATSVEQLQDLLKSTEIKLDGAAVERLNQASAYE